MTKSIAYQLLFLPVINFILFADKALRRKKMMKSIAYQVPFLTAINFYFLPVRRTDNVRCLY